jgi:hypothetical protein
MTEKELIIKPLGFLNQKARPGNVKEATCDHATNTKTAEARIEIKSRCVRLACEILSEDILENRSKARKW